MENFNIATNEERVCVHINICKTCMHAHLRAMVDVMIFSTIEALNGHSPQPFLLPQHKWVYPEGVRVHLVKTANFGSGNGWLRRELAV